jgi:uncharacterized membrane protein (DUF373 family)
MDTSSTSGETDRSRSREDGSPRVIPHTHVHALLRRTLENLLDVVAALLMAILLLLSLQSLWRLARWTIVDGAVTTQVLSEIIYVLMLMEVYRLMIFYLREHRISVALTIEVALVSTLREVMLKGPQEFESPRLLALSVLLVVLGALLAAERWMGERRKDACETDAR